jgi:hypothetical protein
MEDLIFPSVRGKLEKMGVLCTHSSKSLGPFPQLPIKNLKKIKKFQKKRDQADPVQVSTRGRREPSGRHLDRVGLPLFLEFFFSPALHFLRKWSTLADWFQHMPASISFLFLGLELRWRQILLDFKFGGYNCETITYKATNYKARWLLHALCSMNLG